jgi:Xaa-Pro aminopeptidase
MTGFTGSAGCAVVTPGKAVLATDGRYFNQAAKQLDKNWELLKQGIQDVPTWQEWCAEEAAGGKVVAVDPTLISATTAKKLEEKVRASGGARLVALNENLVDIAWGAGRPALPGEPIVVHPVRYAGKSVQAKLVELRQELSKKKSPGFVVSTLDEIAWLFNLRGSDIEYCPVFFSYAIITPASATLYIDNENLSPEAAHQLAENGVSVKPYETLIGDAQSLRDGIIDGSSTKDHSPGRFLISTRASWALKLALGGESRVDEIRSPIGDAKAVKNTTEMEGMRACHIRDGAALIEFFAWLEDQLQTKKTILDEVAAAEKLEQLRRKQKDYVGLSFSTISSTGPK